MSADAEPRVIRLPADGLNGDTTSTGADGQQQPPPFTPPPAPPKTAPRLSGDMRRLRDSIVGVYAGVGTSVAGYAELRAMHAQAQATTESHPVKQQELHASINQWLTWRQAGTNLVDMSGTLADSWIELAQQNATVRMWLERAFTGSTVATLVITHFIAAAPFAAAAGWLPQEIGQRISAMMGFMGAASGGPPAP